MTRINYTSELDVELVQHVGSDASIAAAARVSTGLDLKEYTEDQNAGLINYLAKHRHGSPFEHNSMTFRISAPIFVFREFQRHRIGWSYNEVSARYKKMDPKFYVYPPERPLIQEGSAAHPGLVHGHPAMTPMVNHEMEHAYKVAWKSYNTLLEDGVANEVARSVLPVGLFSEMYATTNARSLMAFLSLRVDAEGATFETKPQWEIEQVALKMEAEFGKMFPATYTAFVKNGRVAP
jgi:thymidylate synthase (FAD)